MYLKDKNCSQLGIIVVLLILAIDLRMAMPSYAQDSKQSIIRDTIVRDIVSSLPISTENICILEASYDGESQSIKPLDLKYLDNRIVTEPSVCGDPPSIDDSQTRIIYINDVGIGIRQMERPSGQAGEMYDWVIKHLDAGNFVAHAALFRCGADIHVYAFKNDTDDPHLIESAVIGSVECQAK